MQMHQLIRPRPEQSFVPRPLHAFEGKCRENLARVDLTVAARSPDLVSLDASRNR